MLRNCYDWDCSDKTNFWEIICDRHYPIEDLPSKTRNQIRRCFRDCDIRIFTPSELINFDGYNVYIKAFSRYHDIAVEIADRKSWEEMISSDKKHEFWGVVVRESNQLIAWAMNTVDIAFVQYNTLKAVPEMMNKHYPYFGLLYKMNQYYLETIGCRYVSDGWRSVTEHSGIQPFLERNFYFRKAYTRMRLYYAPWLEMIIRTLYPIRAFKFLPLKIKNLLKFEEINRQ